MEHLTPGQRVKKAIEAGVDQFGGEACPEIMVELVKSGQVSQERVDDSVRRLLRDKFRLGLFDNPFVDPEAASPDRRQARVPATPANWPSENPLCF